MNFGKIKVAMAVSVTAIVGLMAIAPPAKALTFGERLVFSTNEGGANLATLSDDDDDGIFQFDIGDIAIDPGTAAEFGSGPITDTVLDLQEIAANTFQLVLASGEESVTWLSGLGDGIGGNSRTYSLTDFLLTTKDDSRFPGLLSFDATVNGFFQPPTEGIQGIGGADGYGFLTSTGSSVDSTIIVVPTPAAVLPALVGMGTAAFRKKKREGEEELALAGAEEA